MSTWGRIDADFWPGSRGPEDLGAHIRGELEERDPLAPTGSEDGPSVGIGSDVVYVEGRLRDVSDIPDSVLVLAWFLIHAESCERATLLWEIDGGPRYRYEWSDGELTRLRGVLE